MRLVDLLLSVSGDVPGCVLLDWRAPSAAPSGLWDVSWRLYGIASDLFRVSGEGAGVYFEEGWGWVADHDIDSGQSLTVKNPRGMTITGSAGPSWLYGTAMEHSSLYQYNFSSAQGVTTVTTQTESDYWSVPPTGWAMVHENAEVQMYGSGWVRLAAPAAARARARARASVMSLTPASSLAPSSPRSSTTGSMATRPRCGLRRTRPATASASTCTAPRTCSSATLLLQPTPPSRRSGSATAFPPTSAARERGARGHTSFLGGE